MCKISSFKISKFVLWMFFCICLMKTNVSASKTLDENIYITDVVFKAGTKEVGCAIIPL